MKSMRRSIAAAAQPGSLRQIFPTARMACLASSGSMSPAYSLSSAITDSAVCVSARSARHLTLAYFTPVGSLYLHVYTLRKLYLHVYTFTNVAYVFGHSFRGEGKAGLLLSSKHANKNRRWIKNREERTLERVQVSTYQPFTH